MKIEAVLTLVFCWASFSVACRSSGPVPSDSTSGELDESRPHASDPDDAVDVSGTLFADRADGIHYLSVDVPGFRSLSLEEKRRLVEAIEQSKPVPDGDDGRVLQVMETILRNSQGVPASIRIRLQEYLNHLEIHGQTRNAFSGRRIRPLFIPGELASAIQIALQNGAQFDISELEVSQDPDPMTQTEVILAHIRPMLFGTSVPMAESEADTGTSDSPSESGEALDSGSSSLDIGNRRSPASPLFLTVKPLEESYRRMMEKADRIEMRIREVGGRKSAIPRRPSAEVIPAVLLRPGTAGTVVPETGSLFAMGVYEADSDGNLIFPVNVNAAFTEEMAAALLGAFVPDDAVRTRRLSRRTHVHYAYHALREAFGYGMDGTEKQEPGWLRGRLGDAHERIAHLRADLAVLFLLQDPDIRHSGLIPDEEMALAFWDEYVASVSELLAAGVSLSESPEWSSMVILVNYLIYEGGVSVQWPSPGQLSVVVSDVRRCERAVERLLARVRRIRFVGDGQAARAIIVEYGAVPAGWTRELQGRFAQAGIPYRFAVSYPVIAPVREDGRVVDIRLVSAGP